MRIGEAAGEAGVTAKTVRFWEDQHLLPPPARTVLAVTPASPAASPILIPCSLDIPSGWNV